MIPAKLMWFRGWEMCDSQQMKNEFETDDSQNLDLDDFDPVKVEQRLKANEGLIEMLRMAGLIPFRGEVIRFFKSPKKVERLVLGLCREGIWRDRLPVGVGDILHRIPREERCCGWDLASYFEGGEKVWVLFGYHNEA